MLLTLNACPVSPNTSAERTDAAKRIDKTKDGKLGNCIVCQKYRPKGISHCRIPVQDEAQDNKSCSCHKIKMPSHKDPNNEKKKSS